MGTDNQREDSGNVSRELLEMYGREFKNAEQVIKDGTSVDSGLFIPAINELCYAGRYLGDFNLSDNIDDLYKAISHCICAQDSVYDCLIQYRLGEIRIFLEDYKAIVVSGIIDNYGDYLKQINDVKNRSVQTSDRDDKGLVQSRIKNESYVDVKTKDYETLTKICEFFNLCRNDLNAKLKQVNREKSISRWGSIIIPTISVIIAIMSVAIAILT